MPSDKPFRDVKKLLEKQGYALSRVRGSHHVFTKSGHTPFVVPVHRSMVKYWYYKKVKEL